MNAIKDNFRLIVYPKKTIPYTSIPLTQHEIIAICDEIYEQIKRYVDNVDFFTIDYDTSYCCPECNYTADSNDTDHCCVVAH